MTHDGAEQRLYVVSPPRPRSSNPLKMLEWLRKLKTNANQPSYDISQMMSNRQVRDLMKAVVATCSTAASLHRTAGGKGNPSDGKSLHGVHERARKGVTRENRPEQSVFSINSGGDSTIRSHSLVHTT